MIDQLNIYGMTKLEVAIERLKQIEPRGGSFYLAFSGGKDSCVIKALCDMAEVKYDAHYRVSSVDPPELIRFIKEYHPDVEFEFPRYKDGSVVTMWNLIPQKTMPPTRLVRYCCQYLKENGGEGRDKITGVRWDESVRRRKKRSGLEVEDKRDRTRLDPDNMDEDMVRYCMQSKGFILNPIIDWTTDEVWEFIHRYNIPYCKLYDQGFKRLGCIGCPMATPKEKQREFERYPKFKEAYIRAFDRMIKHQIEGGCSRTARKNTVGLLDDSLTEQTSSSYRYGYEYKDGREFVEAWSKFRGGDTKPSQTKYANGKEAYIWWISE